jgi:uncharacterized caspase-like protein
MFKTLRKSTIWAFGVWLVCHLPGISFAENHALLIGIGNYKQRTLEGPAYDVQALSKMLLSHYGFSEKNLRTLVNQEAVKSRILSEMQRLMKISRPGDRVFIYFSGHGTSRRDELLSLPLPHASGALVPADFKWDSNQSIETQVSQLIVGKRDLRPIFAKLDQDRQVLVVFDTCFSGNTVRGGGKPGSPGVNRYIPLESKSVFSEEQHIGNFAENLKSDEPYPYRNIFYISASTENETAKDIRTDLLYLYPTIDGNPHGVLTDSLLRVLAGQTPVDTNRDGRWSQIEFYRAVRAQVQRRFRQTPQALPKESEQTVPLHGRIFFTRSGGSGIPTGATPPGISAAGYRQGYSSSHALVVGIDKYRLWPNLEYAVKDAQEVAAWLKTRGFQLDMLIDGNATRGKILRKLDAIEKSADENSRVVIYFAGHGQTEDLPGGGESGYIVPVDADTYDWPATMLSMSRLNDKIRQIKAKHIFLIFDACYSGLGLTRSIKRQPEQDSVYIQKMMQSRSIQILTAGSRSEPAIEAEGHGLFTKHLLEALSGAADINGDGHITATEIYATVRPAVTQHSNSRQTPQFGYIEGNGDIIFNHRPRKEETATIFIISRIDGIDVWSGTTEIGRRLPAGRQRLSANAGETIIMVKKGSQTLYRKRVLLQANREFSIHLPPTSDISTDRRPFSMLTIAHPGIENYSNSIACDLDGDGREEIITVSGTHLYALKPDGSIFWKRKFDFPIILNLIDSWNSQTAIGISVIKNKKSHLLLLNSHGEIIWRNDVSVTAHRQLVTAVRERIVHLADIDQDGYEDVLAVRSAESGLKTRGIVLYDRYGKEWWHYTAGPLLQNIVIWPKKSGRPDLIIGTFSPGNGNHELHNETTDRQAYIISIDGFGKTNWVLPMGGYFTGVRVLLADLNADGTQALYAHKYTAYNYREDEGGIYKISRSGRILKRFESGNSILSVIAGRSDGISDSHLYAVDSKSNLFKLNHQLESLQTKSLNPKKSDLQEIRLVGVHDYDGDDVDDILMYSFDRLWFAKNPLAESIPQNKKFYSNLRFQILSQDFSKLIKDVSIGEDWGKRGGFAVRDLDRPNGPYYAFMALSDKVMLFNY